MQTRKTAIVLMVGAVFGAAPLAAGAITVTESFGALRDTTIYADQTSRSNGSGEVMIAGNTGGGFARRALIQFDLDAIPAGSVIREATLSLWVTQAAGNTTSTTPIGLHELRQAWGEGASDAASSPGQGVAAQANDATWNVRFFGSNPATPWTTAGGTFDAVPSATAAVGGPAGATPLQVEWTAAWSGNPGSTRPGLISDIQGWIDDPASNFGWILVGSSAASATARQFATSEFPLAQYRPQLEIIYAPIPEPATTALMGAGLAALAAVARRRRSAGNGAPGDRR